jgi:Pentapeptide repeats (8 copies)
MADQSHLGVLSQGLKNWRKWREHYPSSRPDLSGADLSGANLGSASMPILNRAALEGANLSGANLSGANLSAALRGGPLTQEQIEQATGNEQTKLPEHLKPPASWSQSSNDQQTGDK